MSVLKIATWNVNGIRAREAQVVEWVERERPDVICLQEIKAPPAQVPASLCELQGYRCYWHGERAYSGVGLHDALPIWRSPYPMERKPYLCVEREAVLRRRTDTCDRIRRLSRTP